MGDIKPGTAGLITTGAGLLGSIVNGFTQANQNRLNRKYNTAMYERQRQDALADWDRENAYNSPQAQMERLRAAGLNPNLVYGNGATHSADAVRSSSAPDLSGQAPEFISGNPVGSGLAAYFDTKMKQAQIDMLEKQGDLVAAQAAVQRATETKIFQDIDSGSFKLQSDRSLFPHQYDYQKGLVKKQEADTQFTLDENARHALTTSKSLEEATERILTMQQGRQVTELQKQEIKARIAILRGDLEKQGYELKHLRSGGNPNDPWFVRYYVKVLLKLFGSSE